MTIRIASTAGVSDYDQYLALAREWEEHVRHMQGALRVEGFGDRSSSTLFFDEVWADGDDLLAHVGEMQQSGLLDRLMRLQTMDAPLLLTPTHHPGVDALLDQFGVRRMERFASVVAPGLVHRAG